MIDTQSRITFAWWNTGLTPPRSQRSSHETTELAAIVVHLLVEVLGIDCIALGEISSLDVQLFARECESKRMMWNAADEDPEDIGFGLALLYDAEVLRVVWKQNKIVADGSRSYKLARHYVLGVGGMKTPLHLLVSHWPSRVWRDRDNLAVRDLLGIRLRDAVAEIHNKHGENAHVILTGDYNDEPFDCSLSEMLRSSRDRRLVTKRPSMFYNPFWRKLGELLPHVPGHLRRSCAGTCFDKRGQNTQWRTFDQMMFSKSFLGYSDWELDERLTQVVDFEGFGEHSESLAKTFDHRPIVCGIQKRPEGE